MTNYDYEPDFPWVTLIIFVVVLSLWSCEKTTEDFYSNGQIERVER